MLMDVFTTVLDNAVVNDRNTISKVEVSMGPDVDGKGVRMEFKDHGPGIPDPMKERIFGRLDAEKWSVSGSGLGLAVAREFFKRIGGRVWVEDRMEGDPDQGSSFVLVLPLIPVEDIP
jgi:signal transduction histidine kinase